MINTSSFLITSLIFLSAFHLQAQDLDDVHFQAPVMEQPIAGTVAGEYGRFQVDAGSLSRATFSIPLNLKIDEKAGPLLMSMAPSYAPENPLTEWGMGWSNNLVIRRVNLFSEINYTSDDLASPWGRFVKGNDGYWYPQGLQTKARLSMNENTIKVEAADGSRYEFGEDLIEGGRETGQVYAWYLKRAINQAGQRSVYFYSRDTSARFFLNEIRYGGRSSDLYYRLKISYENLAPNRHIVSLESGRARILDRRVSMVQFDSGKGSIKTPRWAYQFSYKDSELGPSFYLTSLQRIFASGAKEPASLYHYDDKDAYIADASTEYVQKLEPIFADLGDQIISPRHIALLDFNDDGLTDFEVAQKNKIYIQTETGFESINTATSASADPLCGLAGSTSERVRSFARLAGEDSEYRSVVAISEGDGGQTRVKICDIAGQLIYDQVFSGAFYSQTQARFVDLNRDGRPELIAFHDDSYSVLENTSSANTIHFDLKENLTLEGAKNLKIKWYNDVNGDGVVDLLGKNSDAVVVHYGTGTFRFTTEAKVFPLTVAGTALNPLNYAMSFLDINNDGLMDLLATKADAAFLFVNLGYGFQHQEVGALNNRGVNFGYPLMARFTNNGPYQLITPDGQGKALNLALSRASLGMLYQFEDGKGNTIDLSYAYARPEKNLKWQRPLLTSKSNTTLGKGNLKETYGYTALASHSKNKMFLGYGQVQTSTALGLSIVSFRHTNDYSIPVRVTIVDEKTGIIQTNESEVSELNFAGISYPVVSSERISYKDQQNQVYEASLSRFSDFDSYGCPQLLTTKLPDGTLSFERAYLALAVQSFECKPTLEKLSGKHADATLDFAYEKKISYNTAGLVTDVRKIGAGSEVLVAHVDYDDLHRMSKTTSPALGVTTFKYLGDSNILEEVVDPSGMVKKQELDEQDLLPRKMQITRNSDSTESQHFAFDAQERLAKTWSTLYGTEATPAQSYSYAYASSSKPGHLMQKTLMQPNAYLLSAQFFSADGDAIAEAIFQEGQWKFQSLNRVVMENGEQSSWVRNPLATDITSLSLVDLFDQAELKSIALLSMNHSPLSGRSKITGELEKTESVTYSVEDSAIVVLTETNGDQIKKQASRPGVGLVKTTDEIGQTHEFIYDVLGRMRKVIFPSGQNAIRQFDEYGRESQVRYSFSGAMSKTYEAQTGRLSEVAYTDALNQLVYGKRFTYDQAGRALEKIYFGGLELQKFNFTYAGGLLSSISSPDMRKDFVYLPNGKVKEETWLVADHIIRKIYEYGSAQSVISERVEVSDHGNPVAAYKKSFQYGPDGALKTIAVDGEKIADVGYGSFGEFNKLNLGGDDALHLDFNRFSGNLENIALKKNDQESKTAITFNNRGLISAQSLSVNGVSREEKAFAYTDHGFLASETRAAVTKEFSYDTDSLPLRMRGADVVKAPQQLTIDGSVFKLDNFGRMISQNEQTFVYGALGQIKQVYTPTSQISYTYDENANRIASIVGDASVKVSALGLTIVNGRVYEKVVVGGHYVGLLINGRLTPMQIAANGSLTLISDTDASINSPDAFGLRAGENPEDLLAALDYAGHGRELSLDIIRMGARDYSPQLGRFMTPDEYYFENFSEVTKSPVEANLYSYAKNDPINHIDPTGNNAFVLHRYGGDGLRQHNSILIGDPNKGIFYAETSMPEPYFQGILPGPVNTVIENWAAMIGARNEVVFGAPLPNLDHPELQQEFKQSFDLYLEIETTPEQDQKMIQYIQNRQNIETPYIVFINNCQHFVAEVLGRGGIGDGADLLVVQPNTFFESLIHDNAPHIQYSTSIPFLPGYKVDGKLMDK